MDSDSDEASLPSISVLASVVYSPESDDSGKEKLEVPEPDVVNVSTTKSAQAVNNLRNYLLVADLAVAGPPTRRPLGGVVNNVRHV